MNENQLKNNLELHQEKQDQKIIPVIEEITPEDLLNAINPDLRGVESFLTAVENNLNDKRYENDRALLARHPQTNQPLAWLTYNSGTGYINHIENLGLEIRKGVAEALIRYLQQSSNHLSGDSIELPGQRIADKCGFTQNGTHFEWNKSEE